MPQTLEPMMGGKEGLEVAGSFGEREREREREREILSMKVTVGVISIGV